MIGFILGAACGLIELYLLRRLVAAIIGNGHGLLLTAALKLVVLAGFLVVLGFWQPDQLAKAGLGIAASLITGAVICFLSQNRQMERNEGNKE